MLNPDGGMFFCENSDVVGNVMTETPRSCTSRRRSQAHRDQVKDTKCPTVPQPCQMNVAAMKQVARYAKFLVRASAEKRKHRGRLGRGRLRVVLEPLK